MNCSLLIAAGASLAFAASANAAITALITGGTTISNGHTGVLGGTFTAHSSGTAVINRLGFWDAGNDGLAVSHTVGLYLWDGNSYDLVTSATVGAGTGATLEGGYRWANIADYTLSATGGQFYLIYATTTASDGDSWGTTTGFDTSIGTPQLGWYGNGGIGSLGSSADLQGTNTPSPTQVIYNIANVGYAVPEPSAALLGGLGMLALLRRRRA